MNVVTSLKMFSVAVVFMCGVGGFHSTLNAMENNDNYIGRKCSIYRCPHNASFRLNCCYNYICKNCIQRREDFVCPFCWGSKFLITKIDELNEDEEGYIIPTDEINGASISGDGDLSKGEEEPSSKEGSSDED
jgi:hypothetical protein